MSKRKTESGTRILVERELRQVAGVDRAALASVESAFRLLEEGRVRMPPIMHITAGAAGDVDVKSAWVDGLPLIAVKIASGFYGNPARGLPAGSAMMVLLSAATGLCEAVLLDNGYLTDLRTGMAGAVAAKYLAPETVRTVGVIGTGVQARFQVRCLSLVRTFEQVVVWGRSPGKAARYADEMRAEGFEVAVAASPEEAVRSCDLLITATASNRPIVRAAWLRPGQHLTAVGADFPGKCELEPEVLLKADRVVCDRLAQCLGNGELQQVARDGALPAGLAVDELGRLAAGRAPGRRHDRELTVCDLTGTGVQDTAIANAACAAALERGFGMTL